MAHTQQEQLEAFLAHLNGTVEALCYAYGGLVATHPNPSQPLALLNTILEAATKQEASEKPSHQKSAYKAGTIEAIQRLSYSAKIAQDIHAMNQAGSKQ